MDNGLYIMSIPLPPGVNNYKKYRVIYQGGRNVALPYLTKETLDFKEYMKVACKRFQLERNWKKPSKDKYILMELIFYMNKHGRDADNHIKLIQDSLQENGIVDNDSKIIPQVKRLYVDKNDPRVIIKLTILPWVGVFKNETDRHEFIEKNCVECKRFKRNCSILKTLDENKIVEEVNLSEKICKNKK